MYVLILISYTLINILILYAHIFASLNNPFTDIIASIPNIFLATIYLIISIILNKNNVLLKTESFIFFFIYLFSYLLFPVNTQTKSLALGIYNYSNTNAIICDQNTKKSKALNSIEFWQALKMNKCDVIILQEVQDSDYYKDFIIKELHKYFKNPFNVYNYTEFIIASRYPVKVEYASNYRGFLSTIISFPNQKLRIINTHIWTPLETKTPRHDPFINYPLPPFTVRKQQTTELTDYLYNFVYDQTPTIIIGDFNMLPTHSFIHKDLRMLGFKRFKSKKFLTPTFSTSIPIIEIDHVFTNTPNILTKRITLLSTPSDHAMQIIYLNIPK